MFFGLQLARPSSCHVADVAGRLTDKQAIAFQMRFEPARFGMGWPGVRGSVRIMDCAPPLPPRPDRDEVPGRLF